MTETDIINSLLFRNLRKTGFLFIDWIFSETVFRCLRKKLKWYNISGCFLENGESKIAVIFESPFFYSGRLFE